MDKIAVLDFGGQYAHLIANRIRRLNVFSEVIPPTAGPSELEPFSGFILSGGPASVYAPNPPEYNAAIFQTGKPSLGICYGHHLLNHYFQGEVSRGGVQEFGPAMLSLETGHPLFMGLPDSTKVWMSHGDEVSGLPPGFRAIGRTADCINAAVADDKRHLYGLQFHPEVTHTPDGLKILDNFIRITGASRDWTLDSFYALMEKRIVRQCRGKKAFLLVSGGIDSSVAFALLNKVLGPQNVLGLHIDNGLMRKNESAGIMEYMKAEGFGNLVFRDASDSFLELLKEVTEPEKKRRIIGDHFFTVLKEEAAKLKLDSESIVLAQGTTYPDTIESGGTKNAALIKTHHNRVLQALEMLDKGILIEPIADLYKDEVRELGARLNLPVSLIRRHPFPGPGLGVRLLCRRDEPAPDISQAQAEAENALAETGLKCAVIGVNSVGVQGDSRTYAHPCLILGLRNWETCGRVSTLITNNVRKVNRVLIQIGAIGGEGYPPTPTFCTRENLDFLREIDHACTRMLQENDLYDAIWQMPVVLLPLLRAGKPVIVMRPIQSAEAMTADFARIDFNLLDDLWHKLQTLGAGALWYDITPKPPGTIEWE